MQKEFSTSLDGASKIITGLCGPLFLLWPTIMLIALRNEPDKSYQWLLMVIGVLLIITFVGCYLFWPIKYILDKENLCIVRKIGTKKYELSTLKSATAISKKDMGFVLRVFGNGGIFGYTGKFTSKTYGRMNWYVTNQANLILIELKDGDQICISPDDVAGFVKGLK
ncbi:MAG: hypothetical protein RL660_230 [Bacteroidota bacterium]|jgi:hypothetical protein